MPSLREELDEIAELNSVVAVQRRKNGRKALHTRLLQILQAMKEQPYRELRARDLERKAQDVERATQLFLALQHRHEALLEDQEAALADEIEAGQKVQADYDTLADMVVALQDKAYLYRETSVLLDELQPLLDSDQPAASTYQEVFASLQPTMREVKCKAKLYPDDDDIKGFVARISAAADKYQRLVAEASLPKSTTPPPTTSSSRSPSEPPATHVTVSSRLRLDLPKFNGEPTEWLSFKALFTAAMDRDGTGISDQEKCTHLLACMVSSAAKQTVKQFATQVDGYKDALQALEDTYGGNWRIYPQHVAALTKPDHYSYNSDGLRRMRETIDIHLKGLAQCKGDTLHQFLAMMFIQRFDKSMIYEWSNHWDDMEKLPTIQEVREFFRKRELRMVEAPKPQQPKPQQQNQKQQQQKRPSQPVRAVTGATNNNPTTNPTINCPACGKDKHPLGRCSTFLAMDVDKRQETVRKAKFCFNCLYVGHQVRDCPSTYVCRLCKSKLHHTLLHKDSQGSKNDGEVLVTYGDTAGEPSVLSTAKVMVYNGTTQQIGRALLDSGSVPSLVTEALANSLRLQRTPCDRSFTCATGNLLKSKAKVTVNLSAIDSSPSDDTVAVVCHVVRKLPSTIPPDDPEAMLQDPFLAGKMPIADPELGGDVDLLLGVSDSSRCHRGPRLYTNDQAGYVAPTLFGWVLGGQMPGAPTNQTVLMVQPSRNTLDAALERLWELDLVKPKPGLTEDETLAVEHFNDTYQRLPNGRFMVKLPKKPTPPILGESRSTAFRRFIRNEKSLSSRGLLEDYNAARQEYFSLQHAELVPKCQINNKTRLINVIPAHGVLKESSTTTKLRIVFDASCKTSTGNSLNDLLLPGPNLYPHLTTVLTRFRMCKVAFSGDIGKMFREIVLHPDDRDLHRFLHRDEHDNIVDARMLRLTFGVASSLYLATQVLLQLATDVEEEYPEASRLIRQSFYVDDCLAGASSFEEAAVLIDQLRQVLSSAGMTIRKFRSNSPELLQGIPEELREKDESPLTIHDPLMAAKTLGIHWPSNTDQLHISVPLISMEEQATKRKVASAAARVYDVLGLFAPITIRARILLQHMWLAGLDWDEEAPEDIKQVWRCWVNDLPDISQHAVARRLQPNEIPVFSTQLHGFSDASEKAYGAVVYLRTVYSDTSVSVTLVRSKARVAPIKSTTIPRLELVAATLLAQLLEAVSNDLNLPRDSCYAWTDSTIVLAWLHHSPTSLQTFQANRVSTITELTKKEQWRHVRTHDNPADLASRGTTMSILTESDLWWHGPPWLQLEPGQWPHSCLTHNKDDKTGLKSHVTTTVVADQLPQWEFWTRYSRYEKMKRVLARVKRFITNLKRQTQIKTPELTTEELKSAHLTVLKWAQQHSYPEAVSALSNNHTLSKQHALAKYDVRLDDDGMLLVRGRVKESKLHAAREKIPISLKSPITRTLIRSLHREYGHPGTVTMMGILADTYHIPGIRNFLKRLGRTCVICQRTLAQPTTQRMADLPTYRTTPAPPFFRTGLDFAGPFLITRGNPRKPTRLKSYAVLFVCLVTKAVHIELCSDLSTESFLACLKRFCSRRGTPGHIHSDNGTNLVGAKREIMELQELLTSKTTKEGVSQLAGERQLQWHLIPPRTPHFGGLWEAGVKAMKRLLTKKLTAVPLRYDELESVLIEVEAALISRPLGPLSSTDPDAPEPLTAGHFLIGRPLLAPPPTYIEMHAKMSTLKRWNLVQRLSREIWDKWAATCLQAMQSRQKWHLRQRDYRVGDIVLLKDDTISERTWPLGRVIQVHPGKDGRVRVATIRCQRTTYRRGIDRLVLLLESDDGPSGPPAGEDVRAPHQEEDHHTQVGEQPQTSSHSPP